MKAIVLTQEERDRLVILRDRILKFSYEIGKDGEFICRSREDIPALLTYIDELEAQLENFWIWDTKYEAILHVIEAMGKR